MPRNIIPSAECRLERAEMDPVTQAEKIIDQTYIRYKIIFENTGTATILIEDDMTISMVNSELERIAGIGKEQIQGRMKFPELIVEPDREKVMENHRLRRSTPGRAPRNYPCRVMVPNGGVKECILTVALIQGTRQSVASITDVSKQKQLEREFARGSEAERQQMGQILHDDLGSDLAGVKAMSSLLAGQGIFPGGLPVQSFNPKRAAGPKARPPSKTRYTPLSLSWRSVHRYWHHRHKWWTSGHSPFPEPR